MSVEPDLKRGIDFLVVTPGMTHCHIPPVYSCRQTETAVSSDFGFFSLRSRWCRVLFRVGPEVLRGLKQNHSNAVLDYLFAPLVSL